MNDSVKTIYVSRLHKKEYIEAHEMPQYMTNTALKYAQYLDELNRDMPEIDFLRMLVFVMAIEAAYGRKS